MIKVARESDGRVSIALPSPMTGPVIVSPVEARLIAIKLLLAAEDTRP